MSTNPTSAGAALADALEAIPPKARARLLRQIEHLASSHRELVTSPEAAVERFLAVLGAEGKSEHTVRAYAYDLRRFCAFLEARGVETVSEVDPEDVRAFLRSLRAQGVGPSARSRAVSALRRMFDVLGDGLPVHHQPAENVRKPRAPRRLPDVLTVDEVERMLDAVQGRGFVAARDRALVEVMYSTGCRVAEAIALDLDDLDLDRGEVLLRGKGKRERLGFLGEPAVAAVGDYLAAREARIERRGLLFDPTSALFLCHQGRERTCARLTTRSVHRIVSAAAERAGIEKTVGPHTLRRSCATHMLEHGANLRQVQELLGHARVTTTEHYLICSGEYVRDAYAKAHPFERAAEGKGVAVA